MSEENEELAPEDVAYNELVEKNRARAKYIQELREAAQKVENDFNAAQKEIYAAKLAAQEAKRRRDEAARLLAEQEAARRQADALAKRDLEFDALAEEARWRPRVMEHQLFGAKYLAAAERAICADGMGVGKTLQSLAWLDLIQANRTLIFCPGDVMQGFVREATKWSERPVFVLGKIPKAQAQTLIKMVPSAMSKFIFIINYEAWNRNRAILDALIDVGFDSVIVDEAHAIKEIEGVPYKGVEKVVLAMNTCPKCSGRLELKESNWGSQFWVCKTEDWSSRDGSDWTYKDTRSVKNLLLMTGTPILNRPQELFPLLHLVDDKLYRLQNQYIYDFCDYDYNGKIVWKAGGETRLASKIKAFYLRRTHETAGIVLPPQEIIYHDIELDQDLYPLQAEIIKDLHNDAVMKFAEDQAMDVMSMLALITRERQASVWPGGIKIRVPRRDPSTGAYILDPVKPYKKNGDPNPLTDEVPIGQRYQQSQKLDVAMNLIRELVADGRRPVVISQFAEPLKELERRCLADQSLEGEVPLSVIRYDGSTPAHVREQIQRNFDKSIGEEEKWNVLLVNYKTGGVGLTLTNATAMVVLDREWNPGKNEQAYARINRIGQDQATQIHILRLDAPGKIDVWMDNLIDQKLKEIEKFSGAMEESTQTATQMENELREILKGNWGE